MPRVSSAGVLYRWRLTVPTVIVTVFIELQQTRSCCRLIPSCVITCPRTCARNLKRLDCLYSVKSCTLGNETYGNEVRLCKAVKVASVFLKCPNFRPLQTKLFRKARYTRTTLQSQARYLSNSNADKCAKLIPEHIKNSLISYLQEKLWKLYSNSFHKPSTLVYHPSNHAATWCSSGQTCCPVSFLFFHHMFQHTLRSAEFLREPGVLLTLGLIRRKEFQVPDVC